MAASLRRERDRSLGHRRLHSWLFFWPMIKTPYAKPGPPTSQIGDLGTIHRAIRPKENPAKAIWANALWRGSRPLYCRQSLGRQGNASRQPRVPLISIRSHCIDVHDRTQASDRFTRRLNVDTTAAADEIICGTQPEAIWLNQRPVVCLEPEMPAGISYRASAMHTTE
jgi:hypothetical protein